MKPTFVVATVILAGALVQTGCGGSDATRDGPVFVTTIDPFRAIVEPVVGDRARVEKLLPPGASPHTYEARPSDMRKVSSAIAFFFGAEQLDGWAARLEVRRSVEMILWVPDSLKLTLFEHGHGGVDPHFWMDPVLVKTMLPALADSLCAFDREGCATYRRNAREFDGRLAALDDSLAAMLAPVRGSSILLSHPFLGYFARRYGLDVAGVIEEIPGSEPTPRDMQRMVQHARQSGAVAIFTQPQLPARAANAVAEVVALPVIELNPLGTAGGTFSYEELLYYNAEKILKALGARERRTS
jgi:ABC-type Zn uptake system ZnuABC Zn-binding protein ZnuA